MTENDELNPFEGMARKRLPGMHMITACEGGMPLREALAAFFFMMLHDKVRHECLIKKAREEQEEAVQKAVSNSKSPEGATMSNVFGLMDSSLLAFEEWSYLNEEDAATFYTMACGAVEQVQRWICEGVEKPYEIPLGPLVQRPQWATEYFDKLNLEHRREAKVFVDALLAQVPS